MNFQPSSTRISRVSHPGADEREGQDHPRATGLPVSKERGREAVFSLLQAFNHLHQRFGGEAASHQGVRSQLHIIEAKIALLCSIVRLNVFSSSFDVSGIFYWFRLGFFFFTFSSWMLNVLAEHLYVFQCWGGTIRTWWQCESSEWEAKPQHQQSNNNTKTFFAKVLRNEANSLLNATNGSSAESCLSGTRPPLTSCVAFYWQNGVVSLIDCTLMEDPEGTDEECECCILSKDFVLWCGESVFIIKASRWGHIIKNDRQKNKKYT